MRSTFVASCRPPSPASTTATSTSASANASERRRGDDLELGRHELRSPAATRATSLEVGFLPFSRIRSLHDATCGEIVEPTRSPSASRSCSIVTVAVDFPFVPDDVMAGVGLLRVAQLREQRAHPLEPEAVARPRAHRVEPLDARAKAEIPPSRGFRPHVDP